MTIKNHRPFPPRVLECPTFPFLATPCRSFPCTAEHSHIKQNQNLRANYLMIFMNNNITFIIIT